MDSKTYEKVLRKLLGLAKEADGEITFCHEELQDVFGLSPNDVKASFCSLCDLNLVQTISSYPGDDIRVIVNSRAFGYFPAKEEREQNERKTKWSERRWSLMQILLGFLLGLVSGVLLTVWSNTYLSKDNVTSLPTQEPIKNTVNNESTQSN